MKGDLGEAFEKLKQELFFKYRGQIVTKIIGGYQWGGSTFTTIQLAKTAIDEALDSFKNNTQTLK